jgi:hypothetical protein
MSRAREGHEQIPVQCDAARRAQKRYADEWGTSKREGTSMTSIALRRIAAALAIAATSVSIGATGALAQDHVGSNVTIADGTTGMEVGDVLVLAPGVTISGGEVSNETGIGVAIGGGTSAGSAPGGGTNASVAE